MPQQIFGKKTALSIALLFVVLTLTPVIESISFQKNTPPNSHLVLDSKGHQEKTWLPISEFSVIKSIRAPITNQRPESSGSRGYFYAYIGYDPSGEHPMGPITFNTPENIDLLAPGIFPNFCNGADIDAEENWYGCDYAGGLYLIDQETGAQTFIGPTIGVSGMTVDPTTGTWYVTSTDGLYTMNVNTGATTFVGVLDSPQSIIDIACNIQGTMYGFGVGVSQESILYRINKTTGHTTEVGAMGEEFYGSSCCFDRDNNILYIAGYPQGNLYICNTDTGLVTLIGGFGGWAEIDGLSIPWTLNFYDHDISISEIIQPTSGNSEPITPVVKVKNNGMTNEINIPIHLDINKEQVDEYNQTVVIPSIASGEILELSFPEWIPGDLGVVENVDITYTAQAINLFLDNNSENDEAQKEFTLHYGYIHDVAVTQILSPISGHAQTQTPEVLIENNGQNAEAVNVGMVIGKALYTTFLEEDFISGVPPAGWGTNYPQNWFSSSTNYAGGVAPEAEFSWSPSSVGEHYLWTGNIDTTGFTAMSLRFKEYVNDYNGDYTLKVVTSTDGGATWQDAYERAGGPYGPTTTEIVLTAANGIGSATFKIAWDMSGDSFNINYWYVDEVWFGIIDLVEEYNETINTTIDTDTTKNVTFPEWTPADIPFGTTIDYIIDASVSMNVTDGYPTDNELVTLITLSYEHDVGVIEITEPHESVPKDDEGWLQYDNGVYANAFGSTTGHIYTANRFTIDEVGYYLGWKVDTIMFKHYGAESFSGTVRIYDAGSATAPGAMLTSEPFSITGAGWFNVTLTHPITITGSDIWLGAEGTHATGLYPFECSSPGISGKTAFFSSDDATWYDLPSLGYDVAWELRGHVTNYEGPEPPWLPGTYPVEGIIQNLGGIYSEEDIPVNTQVTNDSGVVVYDETVIISGPLVPGQTATATFPTLTIPETVEAEGDYKLIMKTMLVGDDHPNNDKKILTFVIHLGYPHVPPTTTATLSGTMGKHDWFVSNVTVTLTATIPKKNWPVGVNHTYYKIDDGDWIEYFEPFIVSNDGPHIVSYYSDDKCKPPCVEEEKSTSFKIDTTAPSITMSVVKNGFRQWIFNAVVSDETSGMWYVEFFIDYMWLGNISSPGPYDWFWEGKGNHTVTGTAYDNAGNSAENNVVFSLALSEFFFQRFPLLSLFGKIIQRILTHFPMLSNL